VAVDWQHAQIPTLRVQPPEAWETLADVTLRADGMLLYQVAGYEPTQRGGDWTRDDRGRNALEAFTALRLEALAEAIRERLARHDGTHPLADTWDLPGGPELRAFLMTFGPVRVGGGARLPVRNDEADRAESQARAAAFELSLWRSGMTPERPIGPRRLSRDWRVDLSGSAQGRGVSGSVFRVDPATEDEEPLFRLRDLDREVRLALALADALARAQHWRGGDDVRDALRAIVLDQLGGPLVVRGIATPWHRILRDAPEGIHRVVLDAAGARPDEPRSKGEPRQPSVAHPMAVDWMLAGRMLLASLLGRHVQWAQLFLAVDDRGRLATRWITRSLDEVIFLQLLEHIGRLPRLRHVELPYWPIPSCGYCGGVIVTSPRRPDKTRANRWHAGPCRKAGQEAERRRAMAQS
jgi:hypothetical protein